MCTEQKVTIGEPQRWTSHETSNNEQNHTPSTFARGVDLECERLKGVLVEQDSEVRVASVRHELIGGVRNMITAFLQTETETEITNDLHVRHFSMMFG